MPIEQRREQLLDAALAVIVNDGYDRVSIDAIAKRADVARSVVYGAYENLDALLTALLDRQQARAFDCLLETIPDPHGPRDPAAFAAETVRRMSAMLHQDPDTWRLILLPPGNMPTVVRDRIEVDRERFRLRVEAWISSPWPSAVARHPVRSSTRKSSPTHSSPARNTSAAWR